MTGGDEMSTTAPHEGDHEPESELASADVSGMIRRVRRLGGCSQRELAEQLGVSQSAVAKWETGRTTPSSSMLARVLAVAKLRLAPVDETGERVTPMNHVAARDAVGRRYPAHASVWAEGWWAPPDAGMTAWADSILSRSAELELPQVRHSRTGPVRSTTSRELDDHPTWSDLVAEAREGWLPPQRTRVSIPAWALQDSRKSRNRRPDDF